MLTTALLSLALMTNRVEANLVTNPAFATASGYTLTGNAAWSYVGYKDETELHGICFDSSSSASQGSVTQMVTGLNYAAGHWVRFTFRGRAEDGFSVSNDHLAIKMDFYSGNGTNYIDTAERLIYREVLKDRRDFAINGCDGKSGADVWRTYSFEELLPFPQVDSVKLTLGFAGGNSADRKGTHLYATDFALVQEESASDGRVEPSTPAKSPTELATTTGLVHLGGRWWYRPSEGDHLTMPLTVTEENAGRLYYQDDQLVNPFLGNMTAWLRKGYLDIDGKLVTEDRLVRDNVTITFDGSPYWTLHARNIPNHQTAKFPDTYGTQGYNPSYIQEHDYSYKLPLDPKPNPKAIAMTAHDANGALNMGAVGFAVNGVVFYNPFDANMQDASNIMDRCCGHPSPDNRYHYHKYPICVNTPFVDKGEAHSPIIGFALDGLPVYGPYEDKDLMAKDDQAHPLNAFNAHYDPIRGWHYHVTPGKFPYIIGGYFGKYW